MFRPQVVDLYNTPGAYYAAAYWLSSMVFGTVLATGKRTAGIWAKQILILIALCIFMTITHHIPVIFFIPCMIIVFVVICVNLRMGCRLTDREVIYYGARAFIVGEFAAAFDWQLFYYGKNSSLEESDNPLSIFSIDSNDVVSAEVFSINGTRTAGLQRGVNIVRETLSDGTVRVRKITVK